MHEYNYVNQKSLNHNHNNHNLTHNNNHYNNNNLSNSNRKQKGIDDYFEEIDIYAHHLKTLNTKYLKTHLNECSKEIIEIAEKGSERKNRGKNNEQIDINKIVV